MTGVDRFQDLRSFRVESWFRSHEQELITDGRKAYALASAGIHHGSLLSEDVALLLASRIGRNPSLYATLRRMWPNHTQSEVKNAQELVAVIISQMLTENDHYWMQLGERPV
ncbi:MAG: hypothetical protein JJT88_09270 [Gammaproteobacteria bacterium]|nr:hypothetical protein [Gammaproteobacteria bacterium]